MLWDGWWAKLPNALGLTHRGNWLGQKLPPQVAFVRMCMHVYICVCVVISFVMLRFRFVVLQTETPQNLLLRRYG